MIYTNQAGIEGKGKPLDSDRGLSVQSPKDGKPPMLMVQYRGNQRQYFANRLRKLTNVQVVFTTRKLQSCLPSLKSAFSNDLKSRVVYKLSCSGCTSIYVGQTVRHLTSRIEEDKKADSPVGLHLQQCQLEGNNCNIRLLQSHMRLKKNRPYNHWLKGQGHYLLCFSTSRTVGASSVRL